MLNEKTYAHLDELRKYLIRGCSFDTAIKLLLRHTLHEGELDIQYIDKIRFRLIRCIVQDMLRELLEHDLLDDVQDLETTITLITKFIQKDYETLYQYLVGKSETMPAKSLDLKDITAKKQKSKPKRRK